jgi:N utilization substance protein B
MAKCNKYFIKSKRGCSKRDVLPPLPQQVFNRPTLHMGAKKELFGHKVAHLGDLGVKKLRWWLIIFIHVVLRVKEKEYFCTENSGFFIMISRRLLRIKALMALYAFNRRDDGDLAQAEKELLFSIGKSYDLYHYILLLIIELADVAGEKIDLALRKKIPTHEDLNPNRRFADNILVKQLRDNSDLKKFVETKKISWANHPEIPRSLYNKMQKWEPYMEYMGSEKNTYNADKKIISKLVTEFFPVSEDLLAGFEEQSIFWNDDLDYVAAMIDKTFRKFRNESGYQGSLMPLYRNDDDEQYVIRLFRKVILRSKECSELIDRNTTNWEVERIALMDILVMQLAITEIIEFSEIPVKVTLNEYIEIAKYYCTSKSSTFVNGILDKVVREMKNNETFKKTGRGLIGEMEADID